MRVELSYEERILNWMSANPKKRAEHWMAYEQRAFAAIRSILQPLYDAARGGGEGKSDG